MTDQLFDPESFTSSQDSGREPRVPRRGRMAWTRTLRSEGVEPSDGTWHVISTTEGPIEHVHRLDHDASAQMKFGSVMTKCGKVGRSLMTPPKNTDVFTCPECKERP